MVTLDAGIVYFNSHSVLAKFPVLTSPTGDITYSYSRVSQRQTNGELSSDATRDISDEYQHGEGEIRSRGSIQRRS